MRREASLAVQAYRSLSICKQGANENESDCHVPFAEESFRSGYFLLPVYCPSHPDEFFLHRHTGDDASGGLLAFVYCDAANHQAAVDIEVRMVAGGRPSMYYGRRLQEIYHCFRNRVCRADPVRSEERRV